MTLRYLSARDIMTGKKTPPTLADFRLLSLASDVSYDEGLKVFRKLARRFHPDRNFGNLEAAEQFRKIKDAWERIEPTLPKPEKALPIRQPGDSDADYDKKIGEWLAEDINLDELPPDPASSNAVVEDVNSRLAPDAESGLRDWTRQRIHLRKSHFSLEKLTAKEAQNFVASRPNAFAALKVLEFIHPECCLYSALTGKFAVTKAVALVGETAFDDERHKAALRDPFSSIEAAMDSLSSIAPRVIERGERIDPQKLIMDLSWLKEFTQDELAPKISARPSISTTSPDTRVARA
jgi:DnaJ-like protein